MRSCRNVWDDDETLENNNLILDWNNICWTKNRIEIENFLILLTIYQILNFACQNIIQKMKLSRKFLLFYLIQIIEKNIYIMPI